MIVDVVNQIITRIKTEIPEATIISPTQNVSSSFPTITIAETSQIERLDTIDSSGVNHVNPDIEIDIYSNSVTPVSEVKEIRKTIDNVLSGEWGMYRGFDSHVPNYLDNDIYRYKMRYSFTIDENEIIYRR